jgi:hypothetical protein
MKTKKFPENADCPLNNYEKEGLTRILDQLEWREYQRVKHQTSGYVNSKITDYDEDEINAEITIGVDGQWSDTIGITIKRSEILLVL